MGSAGLPAPGGTALNHKAPGLPQSPESRRGARQDGPRGKPEEPDSKDAPDRFRTEGDYLVAASGLRTKSGKFCTTHSLIIAKTRGSATATRF